MKMLVEQTNSKNLLLEQIDGQGVVVEQISSDGSVLGQTMTLEVIGGTGPAGPPGPADTASIVSSENLAAGDIVDIYDNAGTANVRKADGASAGKYATGFVLAAVTSGSNATVYFEGQNNQLTGLTAGARMYLSATTPGEITATAPTGTGQVVQYVGRAINATTIAFEPAQPIVLA
jgi:hypothetical protein